MTVAAPPPQYCSGSQVHDAPFEHGLEALSSQELWGVDPFQIERRWSDDERRFALLIDRHEPRFVRWLKPGPGQFQIEYKSGVPYEPDFVVEPETEFLFVKIKADRELYDTDVLPNARAA